jgi:hypothetical protein
MVDLDTLYVEDSRAAKGNESFRISTRRKDRSNHLGTLKDRDNPSVTQEGVSLVVSLARGKKCFKRSGAQVDFQSFAEHDLQESDGKSKSAKSCAKDLAKNLQLDLGTMTRKTIDDRQWTRIHHLEFKSKR